MFYTNTFRLRPFMARDSFALPEIITDPTKNKNGPWSDYEADQGCKLFFLQSTFHITINANGELTTIAGNHRSECRLPDWGFIF